MNIQEFQRRNDRFRFIATAILITNLILVFGVKQWLDLRDAKLRIQTLEQKVKQLQPKPKLPAKR